MIIGKFTSKNDGYIGKIVTLTHQQAVTLEPAEKGADYRIMIAGAEVGAAWKRTSQAGKSYLSIRLDSPFLPSPVNAALVAQGNGYDLIWSRDERKKDSAEMPKAA